MRRLGVSIVLIALCASLSGPTIAQEPPQDAEGVPDAVRHHAGRVAGIGRDGLQAAKFVGHVVLPTRETE